MVDINTNNMCHSLLFVVGVGHKTLSQYQSISHFFFVKSVFPECGKTPPPRAFHLGLKHRMHFKLFFSKCIYTPFVSGQFKDSPM